MPSSLTDFEVLYTIGSGSYGTCKKVRRKSDGKLFVWKEMDYGSMTETEKQMLVSEVNLLRELKHQNIVKYHERVVDKKRQLLYLIMEYCEGGDLGAIINRYSREGKCFEEEMVWKVLAQCSSALNECHKRKDGKSILHRDLKPANIFLDGQRNVKLGDFGLARVLHETSFAKTFVGTPYYMSPEQMNKLSYNEKSDIWSLGCVLYEMCALRPPFLANNQRELALKIRVGQFSRIPMRYSTELSKIVDKMLSVECNSRPSIESILSLSQVHKYLAGGAAPTQAVSDTLERQQKYEKRLKEREEELKFLEAKLLGREAAVEEREAAVKEREANILIQEQEISKKLAKLKDTITKPTPILCAVKSKALLDSPSKHVSFNMLDEKENEAVKHPTITALREKETNLFVLRERERNDTEYQKRKELRDRLEKARQRATQLRLAQFDNNPKNNHLLNIR